jgi:predicted nucleic acid-binding protein
LIVYCDTGFFFDYMSNTIPAGGVLRTTPRRKRDVSILHSDAAECLEKIDKSHQGITSCHTLYEVEGAMYANLRIRASGVPNAAKMLILSARPVISQVLVVMDLFRIEVKDLTRDLLRAAATDGVFLNDGVKLGDTLHMTIAIHHDADIIMSSDKDILSYDKKLLNTRGTPIRCLDTDGAKLIL